MNVSYSEGHHEIFISATKLTKLICGVAVRNYTSCSYEYFDIAFLLMFSYLYYLPYAATKKILHNLCHTIRFLVRNRFIPNANCVVLFSRCALTCIANQHQFFLPVFVSSPFILLLHLTYTVWFLKVRRAWCGLEFSSCLQQRKTIAMYFLANAVIYNVDVFRRRWQEDFNSRRCRYFLEGYVWVYKWL